MTYINSHRNVINVWKGVTIDFIVIIYKVMVAIKEKSTSISSTQPKAILKSKTREHLNFENNC